MNSCTATAQGRNQIDQSLVVHAIISVKIERFYGSSRYAHADASIHANLEWKCARIHAWVPAGSIDIEFVRLNLVSTWGGWRSCLAWIRKELDATGWKSCMLLQFLDLFAGPDCLLSILISRGIIYTYQERALAARRTFTCCVLCDGCNVSMCRNPRSEKLCRHCIVSEGVCFHKGRKKLEPQLIARFLFYWHRLLVHACIGVEIPKLNLAERERESENATLF